MKDTTKFSDKPAFEPVASQVNFADQEVETTQYWHEQKIFQKSIEQRPADRRWTFLDGPPFITGTPHYGSLLSSLPKDVFGRYWTMKGYRVRRVWGWDGHGLPIENKVEAELNISRKRDIEEKIGVKTFIDHCRQYVTEVSSVWPWYIDRIGRWVDFENPYKTWDNDYMESVMWVFKQMYDGGHVYKGLKVSMYCPHCSTPISNFEVAMDAENYKEVQDQATTYKFQLVDQPDTYILAWSTTPWNKLVTCALAINPELEYVKVKQHDQYYILAASTLEMLGTEDQYQIVEKIPGQQLVGQRYQPHYDYFAGQAEGKLFEIVPASFVSADEGTGVVTIAAYGEDDLKLMKDLGIHVETHLDEEGTIKPEVPTFGGMYYLKANKLIDQDLSDRGLVYKIEDHPHRVPLCWRCHTRLYYSPLDAWYINVQNLKPLLIETNQQVNWYPAHFKHGRFQKNIENAPDWNISRNRYWGSPVPVWECPQGHRYVPGSIKELEQASGQKITDLHKPGIDQVVVSCPECQQPAHRVPEILDSWIEAGSASFAERHFPFNQQEKLTDFFPPDFVAEYTGQIRAWFYVMHVIGAALYQAPAFKNALVEGVVLGTDGRKMSKNFKNYPDPAEMLNAHGGDALRLYLMDTPVMKGEDILISEQSYQQQVRGPLRILWNCFNFFVTYANLDHWQPQPQPAQPASQRLLDQWIMQRYHQLANTVTQALDDYDTAEAISSAKVFISDFSNWYIRRSRDRVGPTAVDQADKDDFYNTTYYVLTSFCQIMAPLIPFITEKIYRHLTGAESVHLTDWPVQTASQINTDLMEQMNLVRHLAELGHSERNNLQIKLKQPLLKATYQAPAQLPDQIEQLLQEELNVLQVVWDSQHPADQLTVTYDTTMTPELQDKGAAREIIRAVQAERKKIGCQLDSQIITYLPSWPQSQTEHIKQQTLSVELRTADTIKVEPVGESI